MDRILTCKLRPEDLEKTAGGLVNLVLKNCIHVTHYAVLRQPFTGEAIRIEAPLPADFRKVFPCGSKDEVYGSEGR